ncbi:protein of unknown function [Azospirillum baldaniorum]|uniref:Uncharacterized protein n=1 Tax=Azospirillum baldaniorum TaxID=1064539 RepID=A0A9P1JNM7_9PROT|nr:protein of unknown function [Azospirillum baldaniorum]
MAGHKDTFIKAINREPFGRQMIGRGTWPVTSLLKNGFREGVYLKKSLPVNVTSERKC